jgi:hypothetical protein
MNNNLILERLIDNEYWEIISINGKYLVVNTKRLKNQENGSTSSETRGAFDSLEEAIKFLNNEN